MPETVLTQAPPARTTSHTITYAFASDLPDATFRCSLDYAPSEPCTSPRTYSDLPEGTHTVLVTAVGPDGVADDTPASQRVLIDSTPPDTVITSVQPPRTNATLQTIEFAASENGSATCTLDGRPVTPCSSPVPLTGLKAGTHTFSVFATDLVGNVDATPVSTTWTVDALRFLGATRVRASNRWRITVALGAPDQPATVRLDITRGRRVAAPPQSAGVAAGRPHRFTITLDLATRRVLRQRGHLDITVAAWIGELAARATKTYTVVAPPGAR
jgi:hypothetical protein